MEHIILVKGLNSEEKADHLDSDLKVSRLNYRISLSNQCVIIEGSNDDIYLAKTIIREAGFIVE